eukprot:1451638-Rhodomonas_salina.1
MGWAVGEVDSTVVSVGRYTAVGGNLNQGGDWGGRKGEQEEAGREAGHRRRNRRTGSRRRGEGQTQGQGRRQGWSERGSEQRVWMGRAFRGSDRDRSFLLPDLRRPPPYSPVRSLPLPFKFIAASLAPPLFSASSPRRLQFCVPAFRSSVTLSLNPSSPHAIPPV